MKLSRTQKIIRNFLLTALLLLIRWFLGGMDPVTPKQALRWEALDGYAIPNRTYEIKLTFRGEGGDTIKTCTRSYENKAWSDLEEEEP